MIAHFADRVLDAIREKNAPACVGLDPLVDRLPITLLRDVGIPVSGEGAIAPDADREAICNALLRFGTGIIETVARYVPILKINIAFFERYGPGGVRVYFDLIRRAQRSGLIVIGDVKRADIGHSSTQYAHAQLATDSLQDLIRPDAVTVNPYFGYDAIRPFVDVAVEQGRGLFVLVQTSNESAAEVQGLTLSDGSTLCQSVAGLVHKWAIGDGLLGRSEYSCIGAVVSPRDLASTERIRSLMPHCLFLVPGFGAQGRTADEVARCFKPDGTGAIVTASRSVIYAYQDARNRETYGDDWRRCVEQGCRDFVEAIRGALPDWSTAS